MNPTTVFVLKRDRRRLEDYKAECEGHWKDPKRAATKDYWKAEIARTTDEILAINAQLYAVGQAAIAEAEKESGQT